MDEEELNDVYDPILLPVGIQLSNPSQMPKAAFVRMATHFMKAQENRENAPELVFRFRGQAMSSEDLEELRDNPKNDADELEKPV